MRITLEVAGRRLQLALTLHRQGSDAAFEPDPQGATCGDLERAPGWDHNAREPIGFTGRRPAPPA